MAVASRVKSNLGSTVEIVSAKDAEEKIPKLKPVPVIRIHKELKAACLSDVEKALDKIVRKEELVVSNVADLLVSLVRKPAKRRETRVDFKVDEGAGSVTVIKDTDGAVTVQIETATGRFGGYASSLKPMLRSLLSNSEHRGML